MNSYAVRAIAGIALAGLSQGVLAEHDRYAYASSTGPRHMAHEAVHYAEVIDAQPIVRYVTVRTPERECWDEQVHTRVSHYDDYSGGYRSTAPATIAGGLIGGVIGRQLGDGRGRDAMTVVGTLVGSAIGNSSAQRRNHARDYRRGYSEPRVETVRRCETVDRVHEEERIDGYRVTYLYNDREYTTRTTHDPGRRIPIEISITPLGNY